MSGNPVFRRCSRFLIAMLFAALAGACQSLVHQPRLYPRPYELVSLAPLDTPSDRLVRQMRVDGAFEKICRVAINLLYDSGWYRVADVTDMITTYDVPRWGGVFRRADWIMEVWIVGGIDAQSTKEIMAFAWCNTPASALEWMEENLARHLRKVARDELTLSQQMNEESEVLGSLWLYERRLIERIGEERRRAARAIDVPCRATEEDTR